ncbi:MAG: DUF4271 domain-containing protein [Muribaculaceae bacterium]|nr:DUF4271 domain-containing protein [Muribaculaceae bacterium]MDE5968242.1 DUF4271 domain-containing protein [Muribaculaceae bacterium]
MPLIKQIYHEEDAPIDHAALMQSATAPADTWHNGLKAEERPVATGAGSMLSTVIVIILALLALNFRHCRRLIKNIPAALFRNRLSVNSFDNHTTSENRTYLILLLLLFICEGVMIVACAPAYGIEIAAVNLVKSALTMSGLAAAFYLFELAAYATVGYAFATPSATREWLRGFNASQAFLAILLILPALIAVVSLQWLSVAVTVACIAYILARSLFIYKGFKIFYNNFPSLLYFILYLCTLEIVPLLIVAKIAKGVLRNL